MSDLSFWLFFVQQLLYIMYTHSRSNLCHSNVSLIGKNQLDILGQECIMSGKIDFSNPSKLSGSGGIFAGAGFLPDLKKVPDSGRSRAEIRYSPSCYLLCCVLLIDWWARLLVKTFHQVLVCFNVVCYWVVVFLLYLKLQFIFISAIVLYIPSSTPCCSTLVTRDCILYNMWL